MNSFPSMLTNRLNRPTATGPESVTLLVQTTVEISEILYAVDDKRSVKKILWLHNLTWLHHELRKDAFKQLHTLCREKVFGLYLHSLSCRANRQ